MSTNAAFYDPLELHELPEPEWKLNCSRVSINQGVLKSVRDLTYDTVELIVKFDEGSKPFSAVAGQYATLHTAGLSKPRSYSFARTPENEAEGEHTFFVRLIPGGEFSGWIESKGRKGAEGTPMTISGPMGKFKLDDSTAPMVCIAGGSGMSAIHAIVEHACNLQVERDCYFFYGARTQKDLYCLEEIEALSKKWNKNFKMEFTPVLSEEPEDSGWTGATGFVTDYFKKEYLDSGKLTVDGCKAYFCGPPPMIDAGIAVLTAAGMSEKDIYYDKFEDARSPAPVIDNSKCVLCDECLMVKPTANCIVEVSKLIPGENGSFSGYERVNPAHSSGLYYNTLYIDEKECIRCYACVEACPAKAISPQHDKKPNTLREITS